MNRAYTLIELLVVIAILGLMAAVGIPAYSKFGQETEFKQKAYEVKELINQLYALSKNPENGSIKCYMAKLSKGDEASAGSVELFSSTDGTNCLSVTALGGTTVSIKKIDLLKTDNLLLNSSDSTALEMRCSTDTSKGCQFSNNTNNSVDTTSYDFQINRSANEFWKFTVFGVVHVIDDGSGDLVPMATSSDANSSKKFNVILSDQ